MTVETAPAIDAVLARRLVDTQFPRWAELPLAVPVVVEVGEPDFGCPWTVSRWLDGEVATVDALSGSHEAAGVLAEFLTALHRFDAEPPEDLAGRPLAARDTATRSVIAEAGDAFDTAAMTELWDAALATPERNPAWRHGDFHTGNLLTTDGRLSAVIDFGAFGVGDPRVAAQTTRQITEALAGG